MSQPAGLSALRRAVAALEPGALPGAGGRFALGLSSLDAWLGGGLARGALHEIHAGQDRDSTAALGFGLGLTARASDGSQVVWIRQDSADCETGQPYGEGLAGFGLDPERCLVVRARDPTCLLRAAAEVARCSGVGAALVEIRGSPKVLDLTATRRLALAAGASGVTLVMIRLGAEPAPSAAATRWRVAAAASVPLEADAPGRPTFAAALLRHRRGLPPRSWRLEWDRDRASFATTQRPSAPLSRPVVPLSAPRSAAAADPVLGRRAG